MTIASSTVWSRTPSAKLEFEPANKVIKVAMNIFLMTSFYYTSERPNNLGEVSFHDDACANLMTDGGGEALGVSWWIAMFDMDTKVPRRAIPGINIVPILDMMTMIIFFLVVTANFIDFTKVTVPPSATVTVSDPLRPPPLSPKVIGKQIDGKLILQISWSGAEPGADREEMTINRKLGPVESAQEIVRTAEKLIQRFKSRFPAEATYQLGLASNVDYQSLISIMDGIQMGVRGAAANDGGAPNGAPVTPANVILISHQEVDTEFSKMGL